MKVIAITKVKTSKGETVDRMQTMIVTLQPGDRTLDEMPTTQVYLRPDEFDANTLLTQPTKY